MKKFLLILLALIMCVSLCACGNDVDEIKEELESWPSWFKEGGSVDNIFEFKDGWCTITIYVFGKVSVTLEGVYSVFNDGTIYISHSFADGEINESHNKNSTIYYTYENDYLRLFFDSAHTDPIESSTIKPDKTY